MDKNEYLNEEKYQKNIKKIKKISLIILLIGLIIGGSVIGIGVSKHLEVNKKYSDENKSKIQSKIDDEKKKLEDEKTKLQSDINELQGKIVELEKNRTNALATEKKKLEDEKNRLTAKGVKYNKFAKYDDGEQYTLLAVTDALDPSFSHCMFDTCKNHELTKEYCSLINKNDEYTKNIKLVNEEIELINKDIAFIDNTLSASTNCTFDSEKDLIAKYCSYKKELDELNEKNGKSFESSKYIPFYMFGGFIIFGTCVIAFSIYMITKRREIAAFSAQQMNPIAKEQMESMGSSLGKAMANVAKEINPEYKSFTCPNCGANLSGTSDVEVCNFCGTKLTKVGKFN